MPEQGDFQALQRRFAAHIRDPENNPAPENIEDRRMAIYRDLFFNNAVNLLAGTYRVLSKIMGPDHWRRLVRQYFSRHVSETPYFLEVPKEFLDYLENEHTRHEDDPPFLLELAHYEWAELALQIETDATPGIDIDPAGNLLESTPVVSPLAWLLAYQYPVHRISPDFQPRAPGDQPTFIVVYRGHDDRVGFIEVNVVTARLLEQLQSQDCKGAPKSGREILEQIATEIGHADVAQVVAGGLDTLEMLHRRSVILGTIKS